MVSTKPGMQWLLLKLDHNMVRMVAVIVNDNDCNILIARYAILPSFEKSFYNKHGFKINICVWFVTISE